MEMAPSPMACVAPPAQQMSAFDEHLDSNGILLKQKTNECCRCFVCQPNIHWTIAHQVPKSADIDFDQLQEGEFWIQEDAGYCGRAWSCWAPGCRATTYRTLDRREWEDARGTAPDSKSLLTHRKNQTCGQNVIVGCGEDGAVRCPMCCCLPYMESFDANGTKLGRTQYMCDLHLFVPKFKVLDAQNNLVYMIRPNTCFGGCCVRCKCDGVKGKCFRVPFYIRDPETMEAHDGGEAAITDLWAGLKNECCFKKNIYSVNWPDKSNRAMRSTLIGSALLIDVALFEQEGQ